MNFFQLTFHRLCQKVMSYDTSVTNINEFIRYWRLFTDTNYCREFSGFSRFTPIAKNADWN